MTTISIIGSAGRRDDARLVSPHLYKKMIQTVKREIEGIENPIIVSGGAAFADHVAISIHLMLGLPLRLYIPCNWDFTNHQYKDTGEFSWKTNPGGTLNYYHRTFSKKMGGNEKKSLQTLNTVLQNEKVVCRVFQGLFERNSMVANSKIIIAFTSGVNGLKAGGTKDTWNKALTQDKRHFSLRTL